MRSEILYYKRYNGADHLKAATEILANPDIQSRLQEFVKYYSFCPPGGRYFTNDENGKEKEKIYCGCETCRAKPENSILNFIFDQFFRIAFYEIKKELASSAEFESKAKLWLKKGLDPFINYQTDNVAYLNAIEIITIIPENPQQIEVYNRFVYRYLLHRGDVGKGRIGLGRRVADFEGRMSRALYPTQLLENTKAALHKELGESSQTQVRTTFNDLIAGSELNWSTVTWDYLITSKILLGNEGYLFLRYLEEYQVKNVNLGFMSYAAAVFADDDIGLPWAEIGSFFDQQALVYGIKLPFPGTLFPEDGSLLSKKEGFIGNLEAFPKSAYYKILHGISSMYTQIPGAVEFRKRLESRFGPLSDFYAGISRNLIDEVLTGLQEFPDASAAFRNGLAYIQEGDDYRTALDNFRVSLELFLKQLLNNQLSIEKQLDILGRYLKDKGVPPGIRGMIRSQIDFYANYQNDHVKHNNKVELTDVNTIFYLTAVFLHRILKTFA